MPFALAVFLCLGSGIALACLSGLRAAPFTSLLLLRTSLSVGFGLGVFSAVFVVCRLCGVASLTLVDGVVFVLLLGAVLLLRTKSEHAIVARSRQSIIAGPRWLQPSLTCTFIVALGVGIYSAVMRARAHPHGDGWDAFAIWNLHARFLFRGGSQWRDGFSPLIPWSHPDYPLLLPGAIAHFWTYLGHDSRLGSSRHRPPLHLLYDRNFIFRTLHTSWHKPSPCWASCHWLQLHSSSSRERRNTPMFLFRSFVLTTIALLCLHDDRSVNTTNSRRVLAAAGFAAAFGAWTKNEGLLFLCAILAARFLTLLRPTILRESLPPDRESHPESWKAFATLLVSAAPVFALIAWFKHSVAPPGDLFSNPSTTLHKLLDPTRYWAVLQWYGKGFFRFGNWLLIPGTLALIGFYLIGGNGRGRKPALGARSSVLALAFTLAGYFVVYLITPYDIYWHLRFSLTRLFLQLWPSAIFLFFLAVPFDENQA